MGGTVTSVIAPAGRAWPAPGAALLGTARSWRGIVSFTHLAREGRMTVTIGRRELLAALGGAAAGGSHRSRGRSLPSLRSGREWIQALAREYQPAAEGPDVISQSLAIAEPLRARSRYRAFAGARSVLSGSNFIP